MSTEQQRMFAPRRYLSRLTRGTLAVIMAGGRGERLKHLTEDRCKPATPFGGKFRIIDFALSNCVNSGIRQISVLTQYKAHSLIQHIQRGWGYLRGEFGEFVEIIPAQQQRGSDWYQGTADALWQNFKRVLPGLREPDADTTRWMGRRPGTPDSLPVIGPSKTTANVWYGFGHGHMGLTWGPTTGRLLAELMTGHRSNIDLEPFRVDRF